MRSHAAAVSHPQTGLNPPCRTWVRDVDELPPIHRVRPGKPGEELLEVIKRTQRQDRPVTTDTVPADRHLNRLHRGQHDRPARISVNRTHLRQRFNLDQQPCLAALCVITQATHRRLVQRQVKPIDQPLIPLHAISMNHTPSPAHPDKQPGQNPRPQPGPDHMTTPNRDSNAGTYCLGGARTELVQQPLPDELIRTELLAGRNGEWVEHRANPLGSRNLDSGLRGYGRRRIAESSLRDRRVPRAQPVSRGSRLACKAWQWSCRWPRAERSDRPWPTVHRGSPNACQ